MREMMIQRGKGGTTGRKFDNKRTGKFLEETFLTMFLTKKVLKMTNF